MHLFIDTEFNGFRGVLLSIGIVSSAGHEFYEVERHEFIQHDPWVKEHVMPILGKEAIPRMKIQAKLMGWLLALPPGPFTFVVDHPADAIHLCRLLELDMPGDWLHFGNFKIEFATDLPGTAQTSLMPHNALADARALRASYMGMETEEEGELRWR